MQTIHLRMEGQWEEIKIIRLRSLEKELSPLRGRCCPAGTGVYEEGTMRLGFGVLGKLQTRVNCCYWN